MGDDGREWLLDICADRRLEKGLGEWDLLDFFGTGEGEGEVEEGRLLEGEAGAL